MKRNLSKYDFINYLKCPRLFYFGINEENIEKLKDNFNNEDQSKELKKEWEEIENKAKIYLEKKYNTKIKKWNKKLEPNSLYKQFGIKYNNISIRTDFIYVNDNLELDIIEVKSTTNIIKLKNNGINYKIDPKNYKYFLDLWFQNEIFIKNLFNINQKYLLVINNEHNNYYDENNQLILDRFFKEEHLDEMYSYENIQKLIKSKKIKEKFNQFLKINPKEIKLEKKIDFEDCSTFFNCDFLDYCKKEAGFNLENNYSTDNICSNNQSKKFINHFYEKKIFDIRDAKIEDLFLNEKNINYDPSKSEITKFWQIINSKEFKEKKEFIDKYEFLKIFEEIKYPILMFDYESFNSAIPPMKNISTYNQNIFQFSAHLINKEDDLESAINNHYGYIVDPENYEQDLINLFKELLVLFKKANTIMAWNDSFERKSTKKAADYFKKIGKKELAKELEKEIINKDSKLFDLGNFVKTKKNKLTNEYKIAFYKEEFKFRWSIKKVLPAIDSKLSYDLLNISNGNDAKDYYYDMFFKKKKDPKVFKDLFEYCKLDTESMVIIYFYFLKIKNKII